MKKIMKALAIITMTLVITLMSVSCGKAQANENFDYILEYFQDSVATKEQQLVHCDITSNDDGYLLTYSYTEDDTTYVAVITFDEECKITRYDVYGDGQYVDKSSK